MFNILAGSVQGSNYEHFRVPCVDGRIPQKPIPEQSISEFLYSQTVISLSLSKATDVGISTKGASESEDFLMVVLRLIK